MTMSDAHRVMWTNSHLSLMMPITYHVDMHVYVVDYGSPIVDPHPIQIDLPYCYHVSDMMTTCE